jgi:deoxycytidine triphosphate deaminase
MVGLGLARYQNENLSFRLETPTVILTSQQIANSNIVLPTSGSGQRNTTYDATVGRIITKQGECKDGQFVLKPRGIVWLVSSEIFSIPDNVTGLATLKTGWTHKGVLALTLGIVDPGWSGPLSTSLVNFSKTDFTINVGDPFFRLIFMEHAPVAATPQVHTMDEYVRSVFAQTGSYSDNFLTIDTLAPEIADRIFGVPKTAFWLGVAALIVAALAIFVPVAIESWSSQGERDAKIAKLEAKVEHLEDAVAD